MTHRGTIFTLLVLLTLTLTLPVWAGGWAVITLDELPVNVVAGEPVTIRFAVRQHGKNLLPGLDATIQAENPTTGERFSVTAEPVENQSGHYQAVLTFPAEGDWRWSIQVFTSNQPMPDLTVTSKAAVSNPPPAKVNPLPITAGFTGLMLAAIAAIVAIRARARWALALVLVGLLAGGAGFALAAGNTQATNQPLADLPPSSNQPGNPVELGQDLFVAKGCVTCHVNGRIEQRFLDIHVDIGPNLTRFAAAPEYLRMWLEDPSAVRPNTEMPNLELDEGEIEALIAFLNESGPSSSLSGVQTRTPEQVVKATSIHSPAPAKAVGGKCATIDQGSSLLISSANSSETRFQLVDPETGLILCGHNPISTGIVIDQRVFAKQNALVVSSANNPAGRNTHLNWIDLATGQSTDLGVKFPGWTRGIISDSQGKQIFALYARLTQGNEPFLRGFTLVRIDRSPQGLILEKELDFDPRLVEVVGGGQEILLYGVKYDYVKGTSISPGIVQLRDAGDLTVLWQAELDGLLEGSQRIETDGAADRFVQWTPAIALSHDEEKLYIVHADADRLTTVDLVNHKIQTVNIQSRLSWIERLLRLTAGVAHAKSLEGTIKQGVLSADGTRLYITGYTGVPEMDASNGMQFEILPLGLQVIQLEDGEEIARIESQARELDLSTDGSYLFLRGWLEDQSFTDVYTTNNLERVAHLESQLLFPAHTLNGESLVMSRPDGRYEGTIDLLDRRTFKVRSSVQGTGNVYISTP